MSKLKMKFSKIENMFLLSSLFFAIIFSLFLPPFSGNDEQIHFDNSCQLTNIEVNRGRLDPNPWGQVSEFNYRKQYGLKGYFKAFYLQKLYRISRKNSIKDHSKSLWSKRQYIVPAMGVWVAFHIYPSLGMMEIFGRLFASIFYSIIMYFVIKKVKYGKLLFFAISLCPTMLLECFSCSYGSINYLVSAGLIVFGINNIFERRKFDKKQLLLLFIFSLVVYVFGKMNSVILLLFDVPILLSMFINTYQNYNSMFISKIKEYKKYLVLLSLVAFLPIACYFFYKGSGLLLHFRRFITTITASNIFEIGLPKWEYLSKGMLTGHGRWTALPIWVYGLWMILLFILIFSVCKLKINRIVCSLSLAVFALNIIVVMAYYSIFENNHNPNSLILGPQGRYFTPLFPLCIFLGQIFNGLKCEISKSCLKRLTYFSVYFSALMLLFKVFQCFYYLGIYEGI
ncbi:MAG: DUF2142 domain-containing protein [Lactobacillales bacterium]|nr:DUF2142 domain-containing protein [Lactobacillales bacterium]